MALHLMRPPRCPARAATARAGATRHDPGPTAARTARVRRRVALLAVALGFLLGVGAITAAVDAVVWL